MRFLLIATIVALFAVSIVAVGPDYAALNDWLAKFSIDVSKLDFVDFDGTGRGVQALSAFKEGEVITEISSSAMITMAVVDESETFSAFFEAHPEIHATYRMALYLLEQKGLGDASPWKAYIDVLPERVETTLNWSEEELSKLQGSSLRNNTLSTVQNMMNDLEAIKALSESEDETVPEFIKSDALNFESLKWAVTMVTSRSFVGKYNDQDAGYLVPLADMFNHGLEPNAVFEFDGESQILRLTAKLDIELGSQIVVSLGDLSNSLLLLRYGFVLDQNPFDGFVMTLVLSEDDPLYKMRQGILEQHKMGGPDTSFVLRRAKLPVALMSALRIHLAKPSEIDRHEYAFADKLISLRNELEVCRTLLASIENLLGRYATTREDDVIALKRKLPERERAAIVLRLAEKNILLSVSEEIQRHWLSLLITGFNESEPLPEKPSSESQVGVSGEDIDDIEVA